MIVSRYKKKSRIGNKHRSEITQPDHQNNDTWSSLVTVNIPNSGEIGTITKDFRVIKTETDHQKSHIVQNPKGWFIQVPANVRQLASVSIQSIKFLFTVQSHELPKTSDYGRDNYIWTPEINVAYNLMFDYPMPYKVEDYMNLRNTSISMYYVQGNKETAIGYIHSPGDFSESSLKKSYADAMSKIFEKTK